MTDVLTTLLDHETRVWQALVDGDATVDAALLSADFLDVYSDGFAGKADHVGQLDRGPTIRRFSLSDPQARSLGPDHALLSYRASFARVAGDTSEVMFVSSIWQRGAEGWINIFSQDTPEA